MSDWKSSPESPSEIRRKIRAGNERRKYARLGTCKRILANCTALGSFLCMLTASTFYQAGSMYSDSMFGSDRPDVVEIFGGHCEVSMQFARRGWNSMEPSDVVYGDDLRDEDTRKGVLERLRKARPRLAIVEYPRTFWSQLASTNYRTNQQKRRLAKLRKKDEPFLELCESIFEEQIKRGDDALAENPLASQSFKVPAMRRIMNHPQVYLGVGHGCRFNLRSSKTNLLIKRPTLWIATSPELCDALSLRCPNRAGAMVHQHGECHGSKVAKDAGRYTPEIGKAIVEGLTRTLLRKDPGRLRGLIRGIKKRLGKFGDDDDRLLRNSLKNVEKIMEENPVFVVNKDDDPMGDLDGPASGEITEYEPATIAPHGIDFKIPKGRKLDQTSRAILRKNSLQSWSSLYQRYSKIHEECWSKAGVGRSCRMDGAQRMCQNKETATSPHSQKSTT